jgi:hypothetical protein
VIKDVVEMNDNVRFVKFEEGRRKEERRWAVR